MDSAQSFTVASYNIHKAIGTDGGYNPERILAVLTEIDADVVLLQEADRRFGPRIAVLPFAMIAARTGYRPVGVGAHPHGLGWHGNAALVSDRVTITAAIPLALPSLEPRGAILVETCIDGHPLRLAGMHLDLSGLRRRQQARAILAQIDARLETMPTVLMGDLNEWRGRSGCLIDFARTYVIAQTEPSFPAGRPLARLDRIMAGPGIEITDCGTHRTPLSRIASDHLPVWATLRFGPDQRV
ncbi:endonuclease/exonuclease/phosphatase family protein [Novosphingobium sp.]|uniref:endonuclease/exonuclease/phosphatase family protein n=1 Tax=Novosphingobium sp. TaxID=1874826 RepID=UPI00261D6A59|nr:endonuclease/exonuclease/phosphatase family protein [Novosphingobium sp.]